MTTAPGFHGLLTAIFAAALAGVAVGAPPDSKTIPLWSGATPGALGQAEKDIPTLTICLPHDAKPTTAGLPVVLVLPGGGYGGLAMGHEGDNVARWLNGIGVGAMILKYRLPTDGYRHPVPLHDAQRAMRLIRARAGEWGVDPHRIGVMGFSAGGHLASTLATHFDDGLATATDPVDHLGCRPDYAVLGYPVITLKLPYTHVGSRDNLLGPNPAPALIEALSNETQVTPRTPPTFLLHTTDDEAVPVENSLLFYQALRKVGVPAELHIYQHGAHGCGVYNQPGPAGETWIEMCEKWMRLNKFID